MTGAIRGGDTRHKLVLAPGQRQRRAIEPLALNLFGRSDDHDRGVGPARQRDRAFDLLIVAAAGRLEIQREPHAESLVAV